MSFREVPSPSPESRRAFAYAVSLFLIAFLVRCKPLWYIDFWWQMADARWILLHHAFPTQSDYSYALPGAHYIAHEWASGMIFYSIYQVFSQRGLAFFCALTFGFFVALFFLSVRARQGHPWTAWLYSLLFMWLAQAWFPMRPELFSNFLMLALCHLEEAERRPSPWLYCALFAVWSNLHGEFACGLVYLFLSLIAAPSRALAARCLGACLGITLNPYGWRVLEVPLHFFMYQNREFNILLEGQRMPGIFNSILITLLLTLGALLWDYRRERRPPRSSSAPRPDGGILGSGPPWREFLLTLIFGIQALKINRLCVIFYLIALPIFYSRCLKLCKRFLPAAGWQPNLGYHLPWVLAALTLWLRLPVVAKTWSEPLDYRSVPVRAVDFLEGIHAQGKMFNSFGFGGYLEWRLYPRIKVFCDSHSYLYTDLIYQWLAAMESPERWTAFQERYDSDFACMDWVWEGGVQPLLGPRWRADPEVSPYERLFPRTRWALIYWDHFSLVFARRSARNRPIIERYALRYTEPLSWDHTLREMAQGEVRREDVVRELKEVQNRAGDNWVVERMLSQLKEASVKK